MITFGVLPFLNSSGIRVWSALVIRRLLQHGSLWMSSISALWNSTINSCYYEHAWIAVLNYLRFYFFVPFWLRVPEMKALNYRASPFDAHQQNLTLKCSQNDKSNNCLCKILPTKIHWSKNHCTRPRHFFCTTETSTKSGKSSFSISTQNSKNRIKKYFLSWFLSTTKKTDFF